MIQASAKLHLSDPQQAGAMGRKKHLIRFQAGLSLPAFLERYGQQAPCRQALFAQRWPQGLVCPACGHRRHCRRHGRDVFQRHRGKHPTSLPPLARYWPTPNCRRGPDSWPCPCSPSTRRASRPWPCAGNWAAATTPPGCSSTT
ncbi:hypothetical protein G4Q83_13165 [Xanthomonas theicola]|nr:hypothetical protein G4Q83_13165 [Xanthomonas theicola]